MKTLIRNAVRSRTASSASYLTNKTLRMPPRYQCSKRSSSYPQERAPGSAGILAGEDLVFHGFRRQDLLRTASAGAPRVLLSQLLALLSSVRASGRYRSTTAYHQFNGSDCLRVSGADPAPTPSPPSAPPHAPHATLCPWRHPLPPSPPAIKHVLSKP